MDNFFFIFRKYLGAELMGLTVVIYLTLQKKPQKTPQVFAKVSVSFCVPTSDL